MLIRIAANEGFVLSPRFCAVSPSVNLRPIGQQAPYAAPCVWVDLNATLRYVADATFRNDSKHKNAKIAQTVSHANFTRSAGDPCRKPSRRGNCAGTARKFPVECAARHAVGFRDRAAGGAGGFSVDFCRRRKTRAG